MKISVAFKLLYSSAFVIFLISCGTSRQAGITFASVTPNLSLPPAYTSRSIYESGVAAYDFYDLVGNVLAISSDNSQQPIFNTSNVANARWDRWRFVFSFSFPFLKNYTKKFTDSKDEKK